MQRQAIVCDGCGRELKEHDAVEARLDFKRRHKIVTADLCEPCADKIPGTQAGKRGRKPKMD